MNNYELAVVFNGNLDEDAKNKALETVQEYVTRFGGTISKVDDWGKRKLAYEVNKINDGFYYFIYFQGESTVPTEVEKYLRIMEPVLRYMTIRIED
ncbi:MAG: 30S ribosomal protein S6 [Epulopiscium sp.]|nr:30S ribosomal protein S6 [Candidatus Epulonipiscium sp.]